MAKYVLGGLAGILLLPLVIMFGVLANADGGEAPGASAAALADIPPHLLPVYQAAAATCPGLDWTIVAAIGKIETDHGRSTLPGVHSGENFAGAGGPMQFLAPTWAAYGRDGDGDGIADRYNPVDAIYGAANYLCASGGGDPARLEQAIFAYNHADWYVRMVLDQAATYRASAASGIRPAPNGETMVADGPTGPITLIRLPAIGWVNGVIAGDVAALLNDAAGAGVNLGGSAWRSSQTQIELRRAHCGTSHYAIYEMPSDQCSPPTARPGTSLHEYGLAIDFTCNSAGTISSQTGPCWTWLAANAARFGLYNLPSEPWHWSTTGR
jgi:hypothetical protein